MDVINTKQESFFKRHDWFSFWAALIVSLGVYVYTLAPSVTLEDSGELAVAGDYLGVPHPPGYPSWSMLAFLFARIFSFVTFRGMPNPAWSIALLSAVCGAISAALTALLISRSASELLKFSKLVTEDLDEKSEQVICAISGISCSLLFAFSPVMWSQSVIVEVYALNAFFLIIVFLLTYYWMHKPTDKLLYITSFLFGLGLTNYQALLLAAVALVIAIMVADIRLFRDFIVTLAPMIAVILLIQMGKIPGIGSPYDTSCFVYITLNFALLAGAYFLLPKGKQVAISILMVELGLAFYVYMPIVSDLRNPPMNWGYPRTWEGFLHALSRGQYEKIAPTDIFSVQFLNQVGGYFTDLREQFTLPVAAIGFLPFAVWKIKVMDRTIHAFNVAFVLCMAATGIIVAEELLVPAGEAPMAPVYKSLIGLVMLIMLVGITTLALNQTRRFWRMLVGKTEATISEKATILIVALGCAVIYLIYVKSLIGCIGVITEPLRANPEIPPAVFNSIIFKSIGIILAAILPVVAAMGTAWLMRSKYELSLTIEERSQNWFAATFTGFLCMSILFIVLANPKGDLQDAFIQKVKFISSHGIYAFWIGYGLVLSLSLVFIKLKKSPAIKAFALATVIALPVIPIHQNYNDPIILKKYGGSEQNQHDFGWQFGNYQLRGADAVTEELDEKAEPLPNPAFPEEMGPAAVFFGGTDPGRFVPTYMIYSAMVRPDVHLITQNALADNTYMSVMRDLYGDKIWIPAANDSAFAFQRYIDEVNSGKRPKNADLKFENGRLQVSGAIGVMEINGILAQMIFEHNNYKHSFYVEESYVLQWMFPYLTPHGLIMKINNNSLASLPAESTNNDMDFWDWYCRKLISDKKFRRDVCAMKSFSKLRSAIAGIYSFRGMMSEAERGFQQSRLLYPLSPEANFRLSQEVYMRQNRFGDVKKIMVDFGKEDPGNRSIEGFLGNITKIEQLSARVIQLEGLIGQGKLNADNALELASLYQQSGNIPKFGNIAQNMLNITNLPPHYFFQLAQMLSNSQMKDEMSKALALCMDKLPEGTPPMVYVEAARMYAMARQLDKATEQINKYLTLTPTDWKAWLDLTSLYMELGKTNLAMKSMDGAIRHGGNNVISIVSKEPRFQALYQQIVNVQQNKRTRSFGY